ncbi:hypothetical protein JCM30760_26540 [Thiomicrorhabdus hydrogeniphila]
MSSNSSDHQFSFDLPEFDDSNYSVKSDALALAALGSKVKAVHKRTFEGLLSKIKSIDLDDFIKNDKPLWVTLSENEYRAMFPRDSKVPEIFKSAAQYYSKNTTVEVWESGNYDEEPTYVNVVDTARIRENGDLQILFTRGVMPHLSEVKERALIMDIRQFSKLSSKYAQKLFEIFSDLIAKDIVSTRIEIVGLRKILSVPVSYNNNRFMKLLLDVAIEEILEKTKLVIEYTPAKGRVGKAFQYIDFIVTVNDSDNSNDIDEISLDLDLEIRPQNLYGELGITDKQFNTIVKMREDKKKPIYQESLNEYFKILKTISEDPKTKSFDEILGIIIMQGYVTRLEKSWFIDESKVDNTQPPLDKTSQEKPKTTLDKTASPPPEDEQFKGVRTPKDLLANVKTRFTPEDN